MGEAEARRPGEPTLVPAGRTGRRQGPAGDPALTRGWVGWGVEGNWPLGFSLLPRLTWGLLFLFLPFIRIYPPLPLSPCFLLLSFEDLQVWGLRQLTGFAPLGKKGSPVASVSPPGKGRAWTRRSVILKLRGGRVRWQL